MSLTDILAWVIFGLTILTILKLNETMVAFVTKVFRREDEPTYTEANQTLQEMENLKRDPTRGN